MIRRLWRWLTRQDRTDYSGAFDSEGNMLPHDQMVGPCPICDAFGVSQH